MMPTASAHEAERVLRSFNLWQLPVNPLEVAKQEGIVIRPGTFGPKFDARIEYYRSVGRTCIFHAEAGGLRTTGRVRFSLAHELGHYYLPVHRQRLLSGGRHNSETDFVSRDPIEVEADQFAADLLMPMELFRQEVGRFRSGFCTLAQLGKLADALGTSLTSTSRRYCESDVEACSIFFSRDGRMHWGIASEDMKRRGMYYCESGRLAPAQSKTAEVWAALQNGDLSLKEGRIPAEVWFKWPKAAYVWEEAMPVGASLVITQLSPAD